MAAGYSQASLRPGFSFAVPGGVTNTITGLAAADMDNVPLFLLLAQAPSHHLARDAHQETAGFVRSHDQIDVVRPVTAYAARVPTAEAAMRIVHAAGRQMMQQRMQQNPALGGGQQLPPGMGGGQMAAQRMQQRPPMQMPPRQGPPIMPQGGQQFGQLPPNMMPQMKPGLQPLPALAAQGAGMVPGVQAGAPKQLQGGYKTY